MTRRIETNPLWHFVGVGGFFLVFKPVFMRLLRLGF